jgi:hypothetical protein
METKLCTSGRPTRRQVRDSSQIGECIFNERFVCVAAGPGESDTRQFSSTVWTYSSVVTPAADASTGLVGPIVVVDPRYVTSEKEAALALPCDLDEELFLLAAKTDETQSW